MSDFEKKPPHVYTAIAEVMGKLAKVGISKDRKNTQQHYNFRGIDDVYNALAPHLSESRLVLLPRVLNRTVTERETKSGGTLFYVVLDVEFDLVSGVDASSHTVRVIGEAMDSGDKATNKAMSAAYKYACMEVFCIPTEGDNDADGTTHEVKPGGGVTIVDPRGENRPKSDPHVVEKWVSKVADALATEDPAAGIYSIHCDLAPDEYLYIDVADELARREVCGKGKWKEMVRHGNPKNRKAAA
jgi:hypothetical protein